MIIKINKNYINVESDYEIVYERLKQFEVRRTYASNTIIIKEDKISINVNNYKLNLNTNIHKTDIYPIINNLIAYLINDEDNLYIHSVLISKNKKGILLLGDFGSGKSSIANESLKYGYEINSSDQTWIRKNKLVMGSMYNKINNEINFLDKNSVKKDIKIEKILIIKGIADNAKLSIVKYDNDEYYIKNIFKYCNWHYDMPILSKYMKLKDTGKKIISFLKKTKIDTYTIRGNEKEILEALNDRKKIVK